MLNVRNRFHQNVLVASNCDDRLCTQCIRIHQTKTKIFHCISSRAHQKCSLSMVWCAERLTVNNAAEYFTRNCRLAMLPNFCSKCTQNPNTKMKWNRTPNILECSIDARRTTRHTMSKRYFLLRRQFHSTTHFLFFFFLLFFFSYSNVHAHFTKSPKCTANVIDRQFTN